jgi:hypothetical protein
MFSRKLMNSMPQAVQLIEDFQEMAHAPGNSVERGHQDNVKAVPPGVGQQLV